MHRDFGKNMLNCLTVYQNIVAEYAANQNGFQHLYKCLSVIDLPCSETKLKCS